MKHVLKMLESDIVRSIKNTKFSPIQFAASRYFKEDINNIEVDYDSIVLWNDEINDYYSYKYCVEDIDRIKVFLDEWNDFADQKIDDFQYDPIEFCIEQKR
jgi:hypothetical protein